MSPAGLDWSVRVAIWDAVLHRVRQRLRDAGLREVTTPVRVAAPAIEPYIEPVAASPGFLATSPELAMKGLLARGGGSIFQVAHVFRAAERRALHREEFHLVEWYRVGEDLTPVQGDVQAMVQDVFAAVDGVTGEGKPPPRGWIAIGLLDLIEEHTGVKLRGDETAFSLREELSSVRGGLEQALRVRDDDAAPTHDDPTETEESDTLRAWTALFTHVSDQVLPGVLRRHAGAGVHVVDFPAALAALAVTREGGGRKIADRFESHVHGLEVANGYDELRDADEQRRRFGVVNRLRMQLGQPPLPLDEAFLEELRDPGLPAVSGVAVGLDRLVLAATARASLDAVTLHLGEP